MSKARPASSASARRDERGSVSIELLIVLPALFAVMFLGVQAALIHHAKSVAIAAVQEGARAAGGEEGTASDGVRAANGFLAKAGGSDVITRTRTTARRATTNVTVTVQGRSLSVIPGWRPRVVQSASRPVERLTAP
ncbi:TadE family protein [Mumia sp. ZJ430]|uniref:TadE/TadG family type IV pilus assembly protein n=1 Tax=Mumia sp. ZJ430 TaxID=2708083 RepID=UPI00141E41B9|nr:TadE family protein [Mumia sp. ZJ430]